LKWIRPSGRIDETELLKRLYFLAIMTVSAPVVLGSASVFIAGFFPFPELFTVFADVPTLVILTGLVLALGAVRPVHRRLAALAREDDENASAAIRRWLHRATFVILAAVAVYTLLGAVTADYSLERHGYVTRGASDHIATATAFFVIVLICMIPLYSLHFEMLSPHFAPRGLAYGAVSLRTQILLLGIGTPVLVDTMLMGYMYNLSGHMSVGTIAL